MKVFLPTCFRLQNQILEFLKNSEQFFQTDFSNLTRCFFKNTWRAWMGFRFEDIKLVSSFDRTYDTSWTSLSTFIICVSCLLLWIWSAHDQLTLKSLIGDQIWLQKAYNYKKKFCIHICSLHNFSIYCITYVIFFVALRVFGCTLNLFRSYSLIGSARSTKPDFG